jgi:5'-nucleotidase
MKKDRRLFLGQISAMAGLAALSKPIASAAAISKRVNSLYASRHCVTVFNTNDLHGNLSPIVSEMGGLIQIRKLIKNQETSGLMLDAGDFLDTSQSIASQKNMIYAMNDAGYHAAAPGNNELAAGQDHLAALAPLMQFSLVNCNYGFNRKLSRFVKPYIVIHSGKYKIGITGVGQQLQGIKYNDAISCANAAAKLLKENEKCDLVICLSHLGYKQPGDMPDSKKLAAQSVHIDMIVSGHNHKMSTAPFILLNKYRKEVIVSQAAWDGLMLGKTVFGFENGRPNDIKAKYFIAGQPPGQTFLRTFSGLRTMEKSPLSA